MEEVKRHHDLHPKEILVWTMIVVQLGIIIHAIVSAALIRILEVGKMSIAKIISLKTAGDKIQNLVNQVEIAMDRTSSFVL